LFIQRRNSCLDRAQWSRQDYLGQTVDWNPQAAAGQLLLFGEDARSLPLSLIGEKVGYCFQNPRQQLLAATVEEEIAFGLVYRGVRRELIDATVNYLLELFEIEHLRHFFPLNLSWGEKRRVVLAACFGPRTAISGADEPTVGLDAERIRTFNRVLARLRDKRHRHAANQP
jgi:energy-coupling factor transporter ATP-binding protein EcfA2